MLQNVGFATPFAFRSGVGQKRKDEYMKKVELLAPAGSYESMVAAVHAGADAVYIGGHKFGARAFADNPGMNRLREAIEYVHLHGRRLYLTVNTLMKERELEAELYDYLNPLYQAGLDGGDRAGHGSRSADSGMVSGSAGACQHTDDADRTIRSSPFKKNGSYKNRDCQGTVA